MELGQLSDSPLPTEFVPRITVKDQPTVDNAGGIMTQHKTSCLAAVLVSLCITFMPGGTNGCTGQVSLTSSISGRNACPSEEVTFTCTARGNVIFWRNEGFGEITLHYQSPPSRGNFRAAVESYNRTQNCLVSSLSFHATASRSGTTVTCTNRDRSSSQSLSLHIISNIVLENFTVVPDSFSSVLLKWKVTPTDGHHCIRNYNIQITGPNGSQREEQISGSRHSYHFTGLQLIHLQNYTCCVTANLDHNQIAYIKQTITIELQEPHPPTNLSAVIQCKQGYEIQIDWQAPLLDQLAAPLTGYLLQYHVYDNTSIIELPLNTSYTLDSVHSGAVYTITVSALSDVGPSRNNPSIQLVNELVPTAIPCDDSLVIAGCCSESPFIPIFTQVLTAVEDAGLEGSCMVPPKRCSNCMQLPEVNSSIPISNQTDCPTNSPASITLYVITALISGVIAFGSGILFAGLCNCILQCHEQWRIDRKSSKYTTGVVTQQRGESPEYEEIPTPESGSQTDVPLQRNAAYVEVQSFH